MLLCCVDWLNFVTHNSKKYVRKKWLINTFRIVEGSKVFLNWAPDFFLNEIKVRALCQNWCILWLWKERSTGLSDGNSRYRRMLGSPLPGSREETPPLPLTAPYHRTTWVCLHHHIPSSPWQEEWSVWFVSAKQLSTCGLSLVFSSAHPHMKLCSPAFTERAHTTGGWPLLPVAAWIV